MAHYLVRAKPKQNLLNELEESLRQNAFLNIRPFGRALTSGLRNARLESDGIALWEEEDYCSPPLKEERAAVLDKYFESIEVEKVKMGEGWKKINDLPRLFPGLA